MNKAVISGSSSGIGKATAELFLEKGYEVFGLDIHAPSISDEKYHHFTLDVTKSEELPDIEDVNIVLPIAGVQNSGRDMEVNFGGAKNVVEKYAFQPSIKAVAFLASSSAHTGFEFSEYSASKGAIISYMKNVAWRLAKQYKAVANSLSFGGVSTELNAPVMEDKVAWEEIMEVTPLKKWLTPQEAAEWIYFISAVNRSCSGQDILIDNGEKDLNCTFVWPEFDK